MKCNELLKWFLKSINLFIENKFVKKKYSDQINIYNSREQHIVHIISGDKFTIGYIKFMEANFSKYRQTFISFCGNPSFDDKSLVQNKNVIILDKAALIILDDKIASLLKLADKIIISGVFHNIQNHLIRFGKSVIKKSYFQFWGGDFYSYRNLKITNVYTFKQKVYDKVNLRKCIKNCAGAINLIYGDWMEFQKLFPYSVKHFVAPMPEDVENQIDYTQYLQQEKIDSTYRILIGNSATDTNNHIEVFALLKRFIDQDIKLIVPLSYGDLQYRDKIIKMGNSVFGDKFIPIVEYMEKSDYVTLLNECDIAIFNNNRQQAMGNINIMLSLGKKVYIRKDTAMWDYYHDAEITLYNITTISSATFMDFITINKNVQVNNSKKMLKIQSQKHWKELWTKVFEDGIDER